MNWLFLRGLVREQAHWGSFLSEFQKKFPRDKISCLDIPGNGELFGEKSPCSIAAMVDSLRARWLEQNVKNPTEPCGLMAISLGGMIASDWLARYPQDFSVVVLMSSSLRSYSPIHKRLRVQIWPRIIRLIFTSCAEKREPLILDLVSNHHRQDKALQDSWIAIQQKHPVSRSNAIRQLWAAASYPPPRKRPSTIPILLLAGRGDRLVDATCSEAIAKRWQVDLKTHPDAGHDLPIDAPAWVLLELEHWLQGKV